MGHIRSRPPIYIPLYKSNLQSPKHTAEPQHCISPSYQWTIRTNEPMDRRLPLTIRHWMTEQLEHPFTNCGVCSQLLETRTYQILTPQVNHENEPQCIIQCSRRPCSYCAGPPQGTNQNKTRCAASITKPHQANQNTMNPCFRRYGMARHTQFEDQNTL